ncbi:CGNR zinc finger domain-containing protein [Solirubrobacter sp. CPCC 204708]|uniref:CGNR zinc finger domain-containing protein n=1 Tax=Solirubrobacter deserti TaxID=2282478 RepID=A0ABT4RJU8_9ACTN|nr:CGNR zinc finger domain-containing protein [Solirubrobacter deserti]MBE2315827.1 CGNR zinc finger domain-containing protein [Solirubrobacter deserti]MDA0138837.1 CGNR zinc finger domain-containing protein [Solirubrobacter deserti]
MATEDPRPLTGEPLPLDLLNTTWMTGDGLRDLLAEEAGTRLWLDGHGFTDAPADAGPLRETREALRALLLDRGAVAGVNAVLARGGERPVLRAGGAVERAVDAAPEWRVPWACAAQLVGLLESHGSRVRPCANDECVLWFLDTSRPGTRRWCSMAACGNRDKAMRHGRVRHR